MTLEEISLSYRVAAEPLRRRLRELRQVAAVETDPEELWQLRHRMAVLTPILTQLNELAELTAHYYERGYWRSEKYTRSQPGQAGAGQAHYGAGAQRASAADPGGLLHPGNDHDGNRPGPVRDAQHGVPHPDAGDGKNLAVSASRPGGL